MTITLPTAAHRLASDLQNGGRGQLAAGRVGDSVGSRLVRASGLPIDPAALASQEGIAVDRVRSLPEAGRIEWVEDQLRILVRQADGPQRRRFTIAHELGHHFLFGVEKVATRHYSTEEEARCNRFAANLLMPRRSFKNAKGALLGMALSAVTLSLRERFDVSLPAIMSRMEELKLIDQSLILLFRRNDHRVVAAAYDRRVYSRIEGLTAQSLGMTDAIGSLMSMPSGSRRLRAKAKLPARIRGQAAGFPSTVLADMTCVPSGPGQVVIDIDPLAGPLGGRPRQRPRPHQGRLISTTRGAHRSI